MLRKSDAAKLRVTPYRLPVRHALRPMHARRYGVPVQYLRRADSRVETPVAFLR